jgi:hypothetical protein
VERLARPIYKSGYGQYLLAICSESRSLAELSAK